MIQFLDTAKEGCKGAVAPIVIQPSELLFNTAADGTTATVISGGASGAAAPYGGTFINRGCTDLEVTATYLQGTTCEPCDTETITTIVVPFIVPANTSMEIPKGFWTELSYVLAAAATDAKPQSVKFQSFYTPDCPECIIVLP